jgi:16S rRNA (guanine966-N2)-methyltransferase
MRIVGGRFRGHALRTPKSDRVRPTSDRLRETLFNVLAHSYGDPVHGARVLDLFAGTGALGLEALSRGAAFALFVEDGVEARGLLRGNVEALGVAGGTRIFRRDATKLGVVHPNSPFTLVFADPPYRKGLAEKALSSARQGGWISPNALVVVEEASDVTFVSPEGFELIEARGYGESRLIFLRPA